MATVKTDSRYYSDIAGKIRERAGTATKYKPSEMADGVETACDTSYSDGLEDGRVNGKQAEAAARDAREAQYLANINTKVTAYGVSEAETLSDVPQTIEVVYNKGGQAGYENGLDDGYLRGHAAGVTEGKQSEYDRFWDTFQDYGNRIDYMWAFRHWNTDYIRPKYKVQNITQSSDSFFQHSTVKKIEAEYFDFTGINQLTLLPPQGAAYAMFNACRQLEEIEDLNIPAGAYYGTWYNCVSLRKIAVIRCTAGKAFTIAFNNCTALEDVTFTGTMSMNGLDLQWSTKLSKASIENIIGVLSASVSGCTVTLSKTAVDKAFETLPGVRDGSTSDAWAALIGTKPTWTVALV